MTDQIVHMIYPESLLNVPVINQLIRRYDVTVNILRAKIDSDQGWMEIQLAGNSMVIENAIEWIKSLGIQVQVRSI